MSDDLWLRPARIARFIIPRYVVESTLDHFRKAGEFESVAYWAAHTTSSPSSVTVSTALIPRSRALRTSFGHMVDVETEAFAEVLAAADEAGLFLVAKVHSHPDGDVRHSPRDDASSMRSVEGVLSIVVPHFGSAPNAPSDWGVHEALHDATWHRWGAAEIEERLHVVPSLWRA